MANSHKNSQSSIKTVNQFRLADHMKIMRSRNDQRRRMVQTPLRYSIPDMTKDRLIPIDQSGMFSPMRTAESVYTKDSLHKPQKKVRYQSNMKIEPKKTRR